MKRPSRPKNLWLVEQTRLGRRAALPVVAAGLAGTATAVGQALVVGAALAAILRGHAPAAWLLAVFAALAVLRAGLAWRSETAAFEAGAAARRRLRTESLGRLLTLGPSLLRQRHSAELAAIVIDRIEALDGFFARWLPAATLAVAAPLLVLLVAAWLDPVAGLVLLLAGLAVPVAMALSGIGAAQAARRQLRALERLQVRFLDRVRGIATIVLAGRAEDEARALGAAADELRARTMRVLRMAFLSSAALDLAAAAAIVALALRYAAMFRAGRPEAVRHGSDGAAAGRRVLRPAARLRRRLSGPQPGRHRRRGAGRVAGARRAAAGPAGPHGGRARRGRGIRGGHPALGSRQGGRRWTASASAWPPARRWCWPARPGRASPASSRSCWASCGRTAAG